MSEPVYCEFQVYRATLEQPAEYCPNEAEPGFEYCIEHFPWEPDYDEDWDRLWDGDIE